MDQWPMASGRLPSLDSGNTTGARETVVSASGPASNKTGESELVARAGRVTS